MSKKKIVSLVLALVLVFTAGVVNKGTFAKAEGEGLVIYRGSASNEENRMPSSQTRYLGLVGGTLSFKCNGQDIDAENVNIECSDTNVLSVAHNRYVGGNVDGQSMISYEPMGIGNATITFTYNDGEQDYSTNLDIEVVDIGIVVGPHFNLNVDESVSIKPSGDIIHVQSYTSSNESVATVDAEGTITAVGAGNCTVYMRFENHDGILGKMYQVTVDGADSSDFDWAQESIDVASSVINSPSTTQETGSYSFVGADGTSQTRAVSPMGIAVTGASSVLPAGSVLTTLQQNAGTDAYNAAVSAVAAKLPNASVGAVMEYNLSSVGGAITQLDGYVTVTVPYPAGLNPGPDQTIGVYRINADGSLTRCETTYNSYQVQFKTNHFSTYAFVVESAKAGSVGTSPKTGEE